MPAKKKNKPKPSKDKLYTYEEYRKAFCVTPEVNDIQNDPSAFGSRLAKEALAKLSIQNEPKER